MAFKTGNPSLTTKTFDGLPIPQESAERMSLQGTVNKSFFLLMLLLAAAAWPWSRFFKTGDPGAITGMMLAGVVGGFVVALVVSFVKTTAPYLSPVYAALEGLALGAISALFEARYPGISVQAVMLTFGVFAALLFAYTSRLIRPSENFKLGIVAATGGIALVYLVSIGLSFFGITMPYLHDSGPIGILVSVVIVVIAALNLVLDFDFIETGVAKGAPRYMEWYAAFGLLVTLVWLYLEILRLLAKTRRR